MLVQSAGRRYRREIGSLMAALNRGVGSGKDGEPKLLPVHPGCCSDFWIGAFDSDRSTLMSEQIILGHIAALTPSEHERFVNNPSIIEELV